MTDTSASTATRAGGLAGLIVVVLTVVTVPLYFIYSGPPPAWNVLTRNLVTILVVPCLIVFLAALRHALRPAGWLADLMYGSGLVYSAMVMVATSLETGPAIADPGNRIDPTTTGPLALGDILLHGSASRAIGALLVGTAALAIFRTGALPRWLAWAGVVVAAANVACVPSIYFGADAASFYSALGWGNSALTASLFSYWAGAAGFAMLRTARQAGNQTRIVDGSRSAQSW